jgi:exodeoxyribonuclease VII large subunit
VARRALVLQRQAAATAGARAAERRAGLDALAAALAAHDPARVLDRGYAMVEDGAGVVTSAQAARAAGAVRLTFADGAVDAEVQG